MTRPGSRLALAAAAALALAAANGDEEKRVLARELEHAVAGYDAQAAEVVLGRARGAAAAGETDVELRLLRVRAGLAVAELLRIDFEGTPEAERTARTTLGQRIDASAEEALAQAGDQFQQGRSRHRGDRSQEHQREHGGSQGRCRPALRQGPAQTVRHCEVLEKSGYHTFRFRARSRPDSPRTRRGGTFPGRRKRGANLETLFRVLVVALLTLLVGIRVFYRVRSGARAERPALAVEGFWVIAFRVALMIPLTAVILANHFLSAVDGWISGRLGAAPSSEPQLEAFLLLCRERGEQRVWT